VKRIAITALIACGLASVAMAHEASKPSASQAASITILYSGGAPSLLIAQPTTKDMCPRARLARARNAKAVFALY
jgi:hypothetical protein